MMKKSILSFLLMFVALATYASRWTAPAAGEFSDRFVVYTQVNINGTPRAYDVEVAAFIDGRVRGVADASKINNNGHLALEVWGNDADNGKTVTFKIAYNSLVYKSTKTLSYRNQSTQTPIPFVLNVDAITGVKLPETIELTQNIGTTYDLSNDVTLLYEALNVDGAPAQYTKLNETTLDTDVTPLTYDWDYANSSSWFEVGANNVLKVNGFCESKYLGLKVQGPVDESVMVALAQFEVSTFTDVTITQPTVPVTSISLSQTSLEMWVGESAWEYLENIVSVLPDDASNKQWYLFAEEGTPARAAIDEKYIAREPGTYTYKIVSQENEQISANITITIKKQVESISWDGTAAEIEINKGENAFEAIAPKIIVNPDDATDKSLDFHPGIPEAFSSTGVANQVGEFRVIVTSKSNPQATVGVLVKVKQPVTGIELSQTTVTMQVNQSAYDFLFNIVKIIPEDASNHEVRLVPNDDAAAAGIGGEDEKYIAKIPGTYSFKVVSAENPSIYKNLTIVVVQPVVGVRWDVPGAAPSVTVWKGDNAFTEIAKHVVIAPENATNKTLTFSHDDDADAFNETGVAMKKGTFTVRVGAVDAIPGLNPLPVTVIVNERVESITATPNTINVNVGDNVSSYIFDNVEINVLPETANNRRYKVQPVADDANYFPNFVASTAGTYTWEVVSDQNPEVKANITVKVVTPVSFTVPEFIELTLMTPGQAAITDITGDFDPSLVTFEGQGDYADVTFDGTNIIVNGKKLGDGEFQVNYNGEQMGVTSFNVGAEIKLESGWNWMSNYTESSIALKQAGSADYITEYFTGSNMIKEARSQTELLYNDTEKYGAFGTIEEFKPNTMYKVHMAGPRSFYPESTELASSEVTITTKGYTWINYPIVGNHSMEYFNNQADLDGFDGCVIMGKEGFAEYNTGKWIASGNFKLETGKGYIFYMPEAGKLVLDFGESYVDEGTSTNAKSLHSNANVWKYDASQFADNMAIVAKINGIEADSRYSVGAFVGEECRGMGQFVTDDVMFINVAGKSGEKVNFRLYDSETGCYADILEGMSYSMKAGSLSAPVSLTPESSATGISTVENAMQSNVKAFNVQGQQVNANAKGIIIVGGKKVVKK